MPLNCDKLVDHEQCSSSWLHVGSRLFDETPGEFLAGFESLVERRIAQYPVELSINVLSAIVGDDLPANPVHLEIARARGNRREIIVSSGDKSAQASLRQHRQQPVAAAEIE